MMDGYGSFSGASSLPVIYKHAGKPTSTGGHAVADLLRAVKRSPTHYYSLLRVMAHYITLSFFIFFFNKARARASIMLFYGAEIWVAPRAPTHLTFKRSQIPARVT